MVKLLLAPGERGVAQSIEYQASGIKKISGQETITNALHGG